jgi:hypothetical protein
MSKCCDKNKYWITDVVWICLGCSLISYQQVSGLQCCQYPQIVYNGRVWTCTTCRTIIDNESLQLSLSSLIECDCGAVKAKTTHANWCSKKENENE